MPDPTWLDTLSAWLAAIATFGYENVGFTLFWVWAMSLFVSTEVAKPFMRRLFTKDEFPDARDNPDYQLVMDTMCPILGLLTGYFVFPSIMSTTQVGDVDAWTGIAVGGMTGWFTKKAYDLRKNKKFMRAVRVGVRNALSKIPLVKELYSADDIKYIEEGTERGRPPVTDADMAAWTDTEKDPPQ